MLIRNFKGIKELTVNFSDYTRIHGRNATGKTTLFDAFTWVLFDKDSNNKRDFDLKPLDANNQPIHNLDTEVQLSLQVNDTPLTLRKVYSERWTKKRGNTTPEFSGHTTDYFVDSVPVKLAEYKQRIAGLVDEELFKLLTSPSYFNEALPWQKRREVLLAISGDISDEEVIKNNIELKDLANILGNKSLENYRKIIIAKRKEINEQLDKLPVRIDEATRSLPDVAGLSKEELQAQIDVKRDTIAQLEETMRQLQTGGQIEILEKQIRVIEALLIEMNTQANAEIHAELQAERLKSSNVSNEIANIEQKLHLADMTSSNLEREMKTAQETIQELRKEWAAVKEEEFMQSIDEICPACGQALPAEKVEEARAKALQHFNTHKSERLEKIEKKGKEYAARLEKIKHDLALIDADKLANEDRKNVETQKLNDISSRIDNLQGKLSTSSETQTYKEKAKEKADLQAKITEIRSSSLAEVNKLREQAIDERDALRAFERKLALFGQVESTQIRIDELTNEEQRLSTEYQRLEGELYLTEEFIRTKVALLEAKINGKFELARFKLFDQQINGGVVETCETTYNGVPYGSGLNNAAHINVGLDIIKTLQKHYNYYLPVWVDNAESVVELLIPDSQMIALYVDKLARKLVKPSKRRRKIKIKRLNN